MREANPIGDRDSTEGGVGENATTDAGDRGRSESVDDDSLLREALGMSVQPPALRLAPGQQIDAYEIVEEALARARKAGIDNALGYIHTAGAGIALDLADPVSD